MKNLIAFFVSMAMNFFLIGCAALWFGSGAGVGVGTVTYIRGELKQVYSYDYERVWNVSLVALNELDIKIIGNEKDAIGGKIWAARSNGTPVTVKIKPLAHQATSVKIRVGKVLWDRDTARLIMSKIGEKLKASN
jgi:hypothetical protein